MSGSGRIRVARYAELIATTGDLYIEAALDLAQMLVKRTAEISEPTIVGRFQDQVPRYLAGVQGLKNTPFMLH